MKARAIAIGLVVSAVFIASAQAQETTRSVDFHGFGGWAYGKTSANRFLAGDPLGDYRQGSVALNFSVHLTPRFSIIGQNFWRQSGEGTETEIDFAFAEWKFSDAIKLRVGKVKQPFGIYAEVFDVGTVRPFLSLPQSVYGQVGIVAEGYQGLGLRGTSALGRGWTAAYDLYGGGIQFESQGAAIDFLRGNPGESTSSSSEMTRDLLGARLVLSLPVPGLSVGGSAYTGRHAGEAGAVRQSVRGLQVEYASNRTWLRGEMVHHTESGTSMANAMYGEAALFLTRQWQLAFLYNRHVTNLDGVDPSTAPSLVKHDEVAFGLNFWFAPELVFKASYHSVLGNRLALPGTDDLAAIIGAGELRTKTRLFQLGGQFSF